MTSCGTWTARATFASRRTANSANDSVATGAARGGSPGSIPLLSLMRHQARDHVQHCTRDRILRVLRNENPATVPGQDSDLVLVGIKPDIAARDVVDDDRVEVLARQLVRGELHPL